MDGEGDPVPGVNGPDEMEVKGPDCPSSPSWVPKPKVHTGSDSTQWI